MKSNKYLIALLLISFFIRIIKIDNLSLFGDELDVGVQAYSLLKTGHDYKGNFLPTYIQSLSESRAPLLIYSTIPSIAIFGLNEFGVRLPSIVFGVLSIFLFYKLIHLLSKSNALSLYSSIALSLTPWHFHYSRTGFEVTLLLSLLLSGVYFIYKFLDNNKNIYLYLSVLFLSLSFYTYNTANIFVPILVLFIFFSNFSKFKSKINLKSFIITVFIFLIIVSPLAYQIFFGTAANRFSLISIFHNQDTINQIITKRTIFSASTPQVESIFHNKPIAWSQVFTKNYLSAFSLPFLFITGDQANLRHSIPGFGLLFITFFPFLVIGLFSLNFKEKLNKLMLFWLIISPIATSLTNNGGNHATRLFLMLPSLSYFIGLGILKIVNSHSMLKIIFLTIITIVFIFETILYSHEYFVHYPKDSFEAFNYGYKEIFQNIPKSSSGRIFISNANYNSLLPFLFYQKYPLRKNTIINDQEQPNVLDNLSGFTLDSNIYFINDWQGQNDTINKITQFTQRGDIFVLFQLKDIPGDLDFSRQPIPVFTSIKTIFNPNNTILAQIIQKQ